MPLDHYISQVHLRRFYSPKLGDRLYAVRKSDLKTFKPTATAVCAIQDGSSNSFLREDRAIEDFLKKIEPHYNQAVEALRAEAITQETVFTLAGFVAFVATCSPAAMRIFSGFLRRNVETVSEMIDARGGFPPPPPQLGGRSMTELMRTGAIRIDVDEKYPQAMGISSILSHAARFGNYSWDILRNDADDSPFFTSDFPVAIEATAHAQWVNRIVPLAPDLAIRIQPDERTPQDKLDLSFPNFRYRSRTPQRLEIVELNRLIVRSAEELVIFRDDHPWVRSFIENNREYRVEPHTQEMRTPKGKLLFFAQRIMKAQSEAADCRHRPDDGGP
jgi:hypothetical protein